MENETPISGEAAALSIAIFLVDTWSETEIMNDASVYFSFSH